MDTDQGKDIDFLMIYSIHQQKGLLLEEDTDAPFMTILHVAAWHIFILLSLLCTF